MRIKIKKWTKKRKDDEAYCLSEENDIWDVPVGEERKIVKDATKAQEITDYGKRNNLSLPFADLWNKFNDDEIAYDRVANELEEIDKELEGNTYTDEVKNQLRLRKEYLNTIADDLEKRLGMED